MSNKNKTNGININNIKYIYNNSNTNIIKLNFNGKKV